MQLEDRSGLQVWSCFAVFIGILCLLSDFAPVRSQAPNQPDASDLGATARQATIAIFEIETPGRLIASFPSRSCNTIRTLGTDCPG